MPMADKGRTQTEHIADLEALNGTRRAPGPGVRNSDTLAGAKSVETPAARKLHAV
jgi:hypothetical protein